MAEPWIYPLDDPMRGVSWRTIVRSRATDDRSPPPPTIRLTRSGNRPELTPAVVGGRSAAGLSEPAFSVPAERIREAWYPLSAADLARLAAGAPDAVSLVDEAGRVETYAVWRVNAAAMAGFLKATESGPN